MGFKPERTHYKLVFADPEWAGFECVMTSTSMEVMVMVAAMSQVPTDQLMKQTDKLDRLFTEVGKCLISWNLEDQYDQPIPATKAGLYTQDIDFILKVVAAWGEAIASVPDPLSSDSNSGKPPLVESLPMEPLSPNPPS